MSVKRIAAVLNLIPHYRLPLWAAVAQERDLEFTIFCQRESGSGLELVHEQLPQEVVAVEGIGDQRVSWQRLPWRRLARDFDALLWYGNPRLLSGPLLATTLRALGRPVVLYGQAHSAGASPFTESLRLRWWKLFDDLLVYTPREVSYLRERGFKKQRISSINNGLDQAQIERERARWGAAERIDFQRREGLSGRCVGVSLGRLVPLQRQALIIEALPRVLRARPDYLHLFIGDGPERPQLEALAAQLGVSDAIRWVGACFEERALAPWLLSAEILVHAGAIGLSLMHGAGYGLPALLHDKWRDHGPEFGAFIPGEHGLTFCAGEAASLAEELVSLISSPERSAMGQAMHQLVCTEYNTSVMAQQLCDSVRAALSR